MASITSYAYIDFMLEGLRRILQQKEHLLLAEEDLRRLASTIQDIQFKLNDAEKTYTEADLKSWFDGLKTKSCELENLLDLSNTELLKSKIERPLKPTPKVLSFIRSFCFSGSEVGHQHHKSIDHINEFIENLDRNGSASVNLCEQCLPLSLFVNTIEVKGRNREKNEIMKLLLDSNSGQLPIICIIGKRGIGKTALAKLVYNDMVAISHFHKRMWVSESNPFDELRIANSILESLSGVPSNLVHLPTVCVQIQQLLKGKRFLLVFSGVWIIDFQRWKPLIHFLLRCGLLGSKILLTTLEDDVPSEMGGANIIQLGELSTEDCWSIISQIAFFGRTKRLRDALEDIGREIAYKCKGLPLAAKIIGGVLRFRKSRTEWQNFLDSDVWEAEESQNNVLLAPLWLSYSDLPLVLRQCFSYCAIFPQNFVIKVDKLIELWMAQGYLGPRTIQTKEIEIIGEEYFQILAARFFFQDFEKDDDGCIVSCKMHHLVHAFVQSICMGDCFSLEIRSTEEQNEISFYEETRHLRMVLLVQVPLPTPLYNMRNLRSLFVQSRRNLAIHGAMLPSVFSQFTHLRSLDLSNCGIKEIPSSISQLIHLRLLILSYNDELKEVPEAVCVLYNLQILDVNFCHGLVKLPHGIGNLVNLRHLHNICYKRVLPTTIKRLSCLRTLNSFPIGQDGEAGVCSLSDLKSMNHLRGYFCISGLENVSNAREAMQARLRKKIGIAALELQFGSKQSGWRKSHDQELIEVLEAPRNLKSLLIEEFQGSTIFPSWLISLTNLRKLSLKDCKNCELLPPLGTLPSLELLVLWNFDRVKRVGIEFSGMGTQIAFPRLRKLVFLHFNEWEEWEDEMGMPCLRSLFIYECPKLKSLPHQLLRDTALDELNIINCHHLDVQQWKGTRQGCSNMSDISRIQTNLEELQCELLELKQKVQDITGAHKRPVSVTWNPPQSQYKAGGRNSPAFGIRDAKATAELQVPQLKVGRKDKPDEATHPAKPPEDTIAELMENESLQWKDNQKKATRAVKASTATSEKEMQGEERPSDQAVNVVKAPTASIENVKKDDLFLLEKLGQKDHQNWATEALLGSAASSMKEVHGEDEPDMTTLDVQASTATNKAEEVFKEDIV